MEIGNPLFLSHDVVACLVNAVIFFFHRAVETLVGTPFQKSVRSDLVADTVVFFVLVAAEPENIAQSIISGYQPFLIISRLAFHPPEL
jgi:hypothetical protein